MASFIDSMLGNIFRKQIEAAAERALKATAKQTTQKSYKELLMTTGLFMYLKVGTVLLKPLHSNQTRY